MTIAPRPLETPEEESRASRLARFQMRHVIDPEYPANARFGPNFCRFCGVRVRPIKGGWRHDLIEASDLLTDFPDRAVTA